MNFEYTSWLLAIPVALLLLGGLFLANSRARKKRVREFASDRLVKQLLASYSPMRRRLKNGLILTALALLLFALARPQWGFTWRETKSKGIDIMFVMDVSRSMLAKDIKPDRLERSKLAVLDFIDKLEGDRVGLVAFAGNAFLQCPLTLDYDAFRQSLEAVNTDVISLGGTDIARAINEAEAAFPDKNNHKILVLITDGEDLEEDGIARAKEAADNGITIYTVGVGTAEGELIPVKDRYGRMGYLRDDNGQLVRTQLDADTLSEIAEVTDGFYTPLGPTGYGLEQVYEAGLEAIPEQELASRMQKVWLERFQWPLGIAIILLAWEPLIGTRRITLRRKVKASSGASNAARTAMKAATWVILLVVTFAMSDLSASVREGERLYRNGDYAAAAEEFKTELEANPLNAQAAFNLGNSLQSLGQIEAAQAAYGKALATTDFELQADAFYNLGSLRYAAAKEKLGGTDLPTIVQQGEEANRQTEIAIQQGNQVLREAQVLNDNSLSSEEKNSALQSIQQKAMQALQFAEQAKALRDETATAAKEAQSAATPISKAWEQAANDFKSSLELNPAGEDAAYNYNYVSKQTEDLKRDLHDLKRVNQRIENKDTQAEMERVIEELRKLVPEQDQQNQDQQNQDQQNQDQQQQNSDQQQQQDQQQQDQQQSGEQNQDQQQNSDSQQDQQGEQGEQSEQTSEEQEQQSGEQDQAEQEQGEQSEESGEEQTGEQDAADSENGEQEGEETHGAERDSEEVDQMIQDMQDGEQPGEEESLAEESGEESQEPGEKPSMQLSEEDAQRAAEEAAARAAAMQEAGEGEPTGEAVPLGVMSRDDARRLLESLKRSEKKLPVSGYGRRESNRDDEGKRKDW
ncbi:VWA domain-containing protein [Cerasicoccus frondis]|uniref:VWA domain-containing protein n=1 Tax=Cerasicoccus frondis TaxID=490090 RepID=UPI0028527966|nr:VWA domain-containing protein [Cerasicoccus frondis]